MKLLLISCGGTIVSYAQSGDHVRSGRVASDQAVIDLKNEIFTPWMIEELNRRLDAERLTSDASRWRLTEAALDHEFAFDLDSTEVTPRVWKKIITTILDKYDQYDGFIVTHGTNTLAYTASALTFGLPRLSKPVVLTGSNIPLGVPFSDAVINGANSVLFAHKMIIRGLGGVVVVFGSRAIPGSRAKKASGAEQQAFSTFQASDIGKLHPKMTLIYDAEFARYECRQIVGSPYEGTLLAKSSADLQETSQLEFSGIISSHTFHPGDDPHTYLAVIDMMRKQQYASGVRGAILIRAVGDGDVSEEIQESVYAAAKKDGIPVIVTTQEPGGESTFRSNDQSKDVETRFGVIPAWDMSIESMVVKMRYLLNTKRNGATLSAEDIKVEFLRNYHGEIRPRTDGDVR